MAGNMKIPTSMKPFFEDGRRAVEELFEAYDKLLGYGFVRDLIHIQKIKAGLAVGEVAEFPIWGFRPKEKPAAKQYLWLLSGVHGEEPPGPEAIANEIEFLGNLSKEIAMVIIPLCNPGARYRGWRYQDEYRDHTRGTSVSDSEHLLLKIEEQSQPRTNQPSNDVAGAITEYVVRNSYLYPPLLSIDFHEDEALPKSYIYSQGKKGTLDLVAKKIVTIMQESGMEIQMTGMTRFDELVVDGVVMATVDGSIDELMAAETIFYQGKVVKKPAAKSAIVVETPTIDVPLKKRVRAHQNIIRALAELWRLAGKGVE